jgi:hypothetical protein
MVAEVEGLQEAKKLFHLFRQHVRNNPSEKEISYRVRKVRTTTD